MKPELRDFRHFSDLLRHELERRCQQNPRYSLRAFAQFLKVEPSFLSKLLRGERSVTTGTVLRFGQRIGLTPEQLDRFREGADARDAAKSASEDDYRRLVLDQFSVIADWYHYALLELTRVEGFKPTTRWIAPKLGISHAEASAAIERLKRLGLLEVRQDGSFACTGSNTTLSNEFTAAAFRKLQSQILTQAQDALENVPFEERSQTSMTMAVDESRIEEAKKRIRAFQRELSELLESGPKRGRVYQLSVSLFPVSHRKGKKA